jgi:hypothetical protein
VDATSIVIDMVNDTTYAEACSAKQILLEGEAPGRAADRTIELAVNAGGFASGMILRVLEICDSPPACRKGCSYCCHVAVEATVPEILAIARFVRERFTQEERDRLMEAVDANIEATEGLSGRERFFSRTPCPLLRDGACSVYEVRPVNCRSWHSEDAERCRAA